MENLSLSCMQRKSRFHMPSLLASAALLASTFLAGCQEAVATSTPVLIPTMVTVETTSAPTVSPTRVQSPSAAQPPFFPLAGIWVGTARGVNQDLKVKIILGEACMTGYQCGSFDLPDLPCSGTFRLVGEENGVYEFQAGDKKGTCGEGRDFLQLLPDFTLQYTSRGDWGETTGILTRQDSVSPLTPPNPGMPVVFNDDGSPDGTTALLYLLSEPAVNLKAVTISYGEAHPQAFIQYMGRMLDQFGFTGIPLGEGQDGPLTGNHAFPEWLRQSTVAYWEPIFPSGGKNYRVQDAASLIVSTINESDEPVTLFVSGPCTDLALALRKDPGIVSKINAVFIMGGAVHVRGNLTDLMPDNGNSVAEWNIYADPQAAKEVFEAGLKLYLVPLDATNQVKVNREIVDQWQAGGMAAGLAARIYQDLLGGSPSAEAAIWDVMTAVVMVRPGLCSFQSMHLEVITAEGNTSGQTVVDPGGKANVQVCLQPDAPLIRRTLIHVFAKSN